MKELDARDPSLCSCCVHRYSPPHRSSGERYARHAVVLMPRGGCVLMQVGPFDKVSILGLQTFAPGKPLTFKGVRPDGTSYEFPVNHTFNDNQITWFKAGSALNAMGKELKGKL